MEEERIDAQGHHAYLRHMKQYVQAPVHRFAAIVPPELARICCGELVSLGFSEATVTDAGVEFFGKLRSCYLPNLCSAHRESHPLPLSSLPCGRGRGIVPEGLELPLGVVVECGSPLRGEGFRSKLTHRA